MPLHAQQLRDDYQHHGDLDEALLRWHEGKLASCEVGDFAALEVAVIDYLVALALSSAPERTETYGCEPEPAAEVPRSVFSPTRLSDRAGRRGTAAD
jgi:hypothetical protein